MRGLDEVWPPVDQLSVPPGGTPPPEAGMPSRPPDDRRISERRTEQG